MGYSVAIEGNVAKTFARKVDCSWKDANQICRNIKGMKLSKAYDFLNRVLEHKDVIRYYKYLNGVGHHNGKIGCYPEKAIKAIMKVLKSAEANAINKGLNKENLVIAHATAYRGYQYRRSLRAWRVASNNPKGPKRGVAVKQYANIEIILKEE